MKILFLLTIFTTISLVTFSQERVLSKEEMYKDFDVLRDKISRINPYLGLKKELLNYSILDTIDSFRSEIEACNKSRDFYLLTTKVMNSCVDGHCAIRTTIDWPAVELYLPLMYRNGKYSAKVAFTYEGNVYPAGSVLTAINGNQEIHAEVARQIPYRYLMRWDVVNKLFYSELFFWSNKYIEAGEITLDFAFGTDTLSTTFKMEGIVQIEKNENRISDKSRVEYLEDEQILYLRVPSMNWKLRNFYKKEIPRMADGKSIAKVVIDVRDNAGGSSVVGRTIFRTILAEPFQLPLKVKGQNPENFSRRYRKLHGISKNATLERVDSVEGGEMYIYADRTDEIVPFKQSIKHSGSVYIIGNEHIFSAGGAIFAFANASTTDSIFSIGTPTGWFLGEFYDPIEFQLPNSKIEGIISSSCAMSVNGMEDAQLDRYDFEVFPTERDYDVRYKFNGGVYSREFLVNYDPYFSVVLNAK